MFLCFVVSVTGVFFNRRNWWQIVISACIGGVVTSMLLIFLIWILFASTRIDNSSRYGPIRSPNEEEFTDRFQKHAFPLGFLCAGAVATLLTKPGNTNGSLHPTP